MDEQSPKTSIWAGIRTEFERFRWGGGVVTNTTAAVVAAFIAIATAAWALAAHPIIAVCVIGCVLVLAVLYLLGTWRFADKHPDLAALGGTEYLKYRQLEMGTKEIPSIPAAENVVAPRISQQGRQG